MTEPVEGGGAEQSVGEGIALLGEVEVGGDGRALFVALGDEVVEVLVLRGPQGFEAEVIDDEQRHAGEGEGDRRGRAADGDAGDASHVRNRRDEETRWHRWSADRARLLDIIATRAERKTAHRGRLCVPDDTRGPLVGEGIRAASHHNLR